MTCPLSCMVGPMGQTCNFLVMRVFTQTSITTKLTGRTDTFKYVGTCSNHRTVFPCCTGGDSPSHLGLCNTTEFAGRAGDDESSAGIQVRSAPRASWWGDYFEQRISVHFSGWTGFRLSLAAELFFASRPRADSKILWPGEIEGKGSIANCARRNQKAWL